MYHNLFRELLAFFDELNAPQWEGWNRALEMPKQPVDTHVGIFLHRPPLPTESDLATPTNTRVFAWTGLDGCHYNFLLSDGTVQENSPVVMTCYGINVVVGEDLFDFLCFGAGTGYAAMQDLALEPEEFVQAYPAPGQFAPWIQPEAR